MINYYRDYIEGYSEIVLPLTVLTRKQVPNALLWGEKEQDSFETVKRKLIELPKLAAPSLTRRFILSTDASEKAVAACLSQKSDGGKELPVAFLS